MTAMTTIDALVETIVRLRPEMAAAAPPGPDTTLADLGLDSLDTIRLVSQVEERFRVQLDEEGLLAAETVGDLARLVEAATAARAA
jgi:acyl carrier protein